MLVRSSWRHFPSSPLTLPNLLFRLKKKTLLVSRWRGVGIVHMSTSVGRGKAAVALVLSFCSAPRPGLSIGRPGGFPLADHELFFTLFKARLALTCPGNSCCSDGSIVSTGSAACQHIPSHFVPLKQHGRDKNAGNEMILGYTLHAVTAHKRGSERADVSVTIQIIVQTTGQTTFLFETN